MQFDTSIFPDIPQKLDCLDGYRSYCYHYVQAPAQTEPPAENSTRNCSNLPQLQQLQQPASNPNVLVMQQLATALSSLMP
jgi:hypothetical protein